MSRWPGDWNCSTCQHHNFSRRDTCQHCGFSRSGCGGDLLVGGFGGGSSFAFSTAAAAAAVEVRPGDWYCFCGGHNFASRSNCHKCGGIKESSAVGCFDVAAGNDAPSPRAPAEWKSGDWLCTRSGCNQHNFASRRECFRCKAPRGGGILH
ncbi:zinc finger Ran-binding domain-containing protein 2-like [Zingiber officinale]|uniref:zinc finger Ran-binding domain-containing protein 2-like n=1 Tax=Zingiber officinale TaxID=94328 RepID=UPI001C4D83B0|nr:zinc finger Ran-binding domain-containing protein 2-like [Zingiber officinale]